METEGKERKKREEKGKLCYLSYQHESLLHSNRQPYGGDNDLTKPEKNSKVSGKVLEF